MLLALVPQVRDLLITAADSMIVPRFQTLGNDDVRTKSSPTDLVTIADVETEEWLTPRLSALLPGSVVVGEEAVATDARVLDHLDGDAPVWVVDPVDGTRNFANGSDTFVTMLALVQNGIPCFGMIWRPLKRELLWAVKGHGAWKEVEDHEPIKLKTRSDVPPVGTLAGSVSFKWLDQGDQQRVRKNVDKVSMPVGLGCSGEEYARLAEGRTDYAVFGLLNAWDHCPGLAIVREAGGIDALPSVAPYTTAARRERLLVAANPATMTTVRDTLFAD